MTTIEASGRDEFPKSFNEYLATVCDQSFVSYSDKLTLLQTWQAGARAERERSAGLVSALEAIENATDSHAYQQTNQQINKMCNEALEKFNEAK